VTEMVVLVLLGGFLAFLVTLAFLYERYQSRRVLKAFEDAQDRRRMRILEEMARKDWQPPKAAPEPPENE
jgi:hypothetical protein